MRLDQKQIGKRIERRRKKLKFSQTELGDKIGIAQASISEWESGMRWIRPDAIKALARALKTTIEYLMIGI